MGKTGQQKHDLDSYTIQRIEQVIKVGDQVLLQSPVPDGPPYVARVDKLESTYKRNGQAEVKVSVQWYYKPEDTSQGRKDYHGTKELFLSDHYDPQSVDSIIGMCTVHSFGDYVKLDNVGDQDFYYRFEYKSESGELKLGDPDWSCICGVHYNADLATDQSMVQCYGCKLRFHYACLKVEKLFGQAICLWWCPKCKNDSSVTERRNSHGQEQAAEDGEKSEPEARKKTKRRRLKKEL